MSASGRTRNEIRGTDARFDVEVERYGALGIHEISRAGHALDRRDLERFLAVDLDTLCPLDRADITIRRRGAK